MAAAHTTVVPLPVRRERLLVSEALDRALRIFHQRRCDGGEFPDETVRDGGVLATMARECEAAIASLRLEARDEERQRCAGLIEAWLQDMPDYQDLRPA